MIEKNSFGMTLEELEDAYVDVVDEATTKMINKHFHWVNINKICKICYETILEIEE